jgi:hypothetical protein
MHTVVNASLMAPLDMARFALAYVALAIVPGYAVATLLRPRAPRSERLALAIPCAYSLVAITGLATALLHVPFGLVAYAVPALPITLAGAHAVRRARPRRAATGEHWWLLAAGAVLAELSAAILVYGHHITPTGWDVATHVSWTHLITQSHVYPHIGADGGGFYPPAFHALSALLLSAAPMAAYRAVFFNVVASSVMLPLALFSYTRIATGSSRLGGLAAVASLAFEPLPFFVLAEGLYPFIASQLFIPALAIALPDGLGRGDRRASALAALLGIGLFYTHSTEFCSAGLLALAVVPGLLRNVRSWARALGYGAVIAAAWGAAAVPVLAAVHRTVATGAATEVRLKQLYVPLPHVNLQRVLNEYMYYVYEHTFSYVLLIAVVGIGWCLVRRRMIGLVAAQAILFAIFVDSNTYNVLRQFYTLSHPWGLWQRLTATHYWFTLPLAAIGIDVVARSIGRLLSRKRLALVALIASPAVVFGLLPPVAVITARAAAYADLRAVATPADLGALTWLARHAAPGSVAVNDGDTGHGGIYDIPGDAGLWMQILGGPRPLFPSNSAGPGTLDDEFYVLRHIADDPLPSRAARFITQYHVRYVFYGARIRVMATRHLNLPRLLADPYLHLVYSSASTCQDDNSRGPMACPASASYVFALNAPKPATS